MITHGYHFENGKKIPMTEKGKYIKDPTVAKALLPTTKGFFFGSTDDDQYYKDLVDTKNILEEAFKYMRGITNINPVGKIFPFCPFAF